MKKFSLKNHWQFVGRSPQDLPINHIEKPEHDPTRWLPISVPGDVNAALVQQGKMPDPHYDTQARECYWVSGQEWWYRRTFDREEITDAHTDLCLTGVDGHADLWVNDIYLGTLKNAFREHRFSLKDSLVQGENVLWLRFQAIDSVMHTPRFDELAGWAGRRAIVRKPGFTFGWDWALPLPSIGLSDDGWIETQAHLRLIDFSIQPFCSGRVDMGFEVTPEVKDAGYEIRVSVVGHGAELQHTVVRDAHKSYCSLTIPDPQLWWPNGYGQSALYDYNVQLVVDGTVVEERKGKFGLRESRIVERPFTPDAGPGFSFNIEINRETVFCRGGNMIPLDLAPGLATTEGYEWYLRKAKEAGFNMLRIWGGGQG